MKILFYISTIRGGGAARVMVNIANEMAERGYTICFVTNFRAEHEYVLNKQIKRCILEATESKSNVLTKNISRIIALNRVIKIEKPDVSIAFMKENNIRLMLASLGKTTKTIISVRNDPAREYPSKALKLFANFLFKNADGIVFQTEDAKREFPISIQRKSQVILNQVDERFFYSKKDRGEYFVACGRLSKQKNYPLMLSAFSEVLKVYPNEKLRIYGEGELRESLISMTEALKIADSVSFMGFTQNMEDVYRDAKILLMTSDFEGLPNVVMEAMAMGVICISTDCPCGGPRMLITNNVDGKLVPVNNKAQLVEAVLSVLGDSNMAYEMSNAARRSANRFKPSIIAQQWEDYIKLTSK